MNVVIIGLGAIGKKRLQALKELQKEGIPIDNIGIYDPYLSIEKRNDTSVKYYLTVEEVKNSHPDWVIICTPHDVSPKLIKQIIPWGCQILVEKPFARTFAEAYDVFSSLLSYDQLYVGFNYRFYYGISAIIKDINRNLFGKLISLNLVIGHGGKPSDISSWKLDYKKGGSGCLLDPGIHLLDLVKQSLLYDIIPLSGRYWRGFWNNNIEEECHLLLEGNDCVVNVQTSLVKWANTLHIEVNGTEGYGILDGRGGNYGEQIYTRGKRWAWLAGGEQRKTEEIIVKSNCEDSFHDELDALFGNKDKYYLNPCNAYNALKVMELYDQCLKVIQ